MFAGLIAAVLSTGLQGLDAMALPLTQAWQPAVWTTGLGTSYGTTAIAAAALLLGLVAMRARSRNRWRSYARARGARGCRPRARRQRPCGHRRTVVRQPSVGVPPCRLRRVLDRSAAAAGRAGARRAGGRSVAGAVFACDSVRAGRARRDGRLARVPATRSRRCTMDHGLRERAVPQTRLRSGAVGSGRGQPLSAGAAVRTSRRRARVRSRPRSRPSSRSRSRSSAWSRSGASRRRRARSRPPSRSRFTSTIRRR